MKNRLFTAIVALLIAIACSAQTSRSSNIREKLNAFVESKEYGVHQLISKDGLNVYQFAQQFAIGEELDSKYYGPLFTPRMLDLEKAFRGEAVNAKTVYIHDASDGDSPLPGVKFQLMTDTQHPMIHNVSFDLNKNIRLISFEEADGRIYVLLLMWDQTVDPDKKIGDTFLMDGMIYEISGWKMNDRPYIAHYKQPSASGTFVAGLQYNAPADAMSVEEFMAKVKRTCEIFQRETPQGKMAAGVVLNKTCNAFNGKLTKEQYYDLLSNIQPLVDSEKNENLKSILAYSCYMIYKKSDAYEGDRNTDVTSAHAGASETTTSQVSKTIVYNSMLMNEMVEKEMIDCQISGTAPLNGNKVEVRRSITSELLGTCPVTNGKFSFTCKLPEKRKPGTPYTNLELVDTKGRPHQLSEYIGKGYVVLHFWHGLGGYGYQIHPSMKTLYDTYHPRGVEFVTLAFNFGVQGWREEVKQRGLTWPQLMPNPDTNPRDALAAYGIRSYPELIVIDAKGTIVACPRNMEELESVLKELR